MKSKIQLRVAVVALTLFLATGSVARAGAEEVCGRLSRVGDVDVLQVWGTPDQRGYAHGYLMAERIKAIFTAYIGDKRFGGPEFHNSVVIPAMGAPFLAIEPRFAAEMEGMLRGMKDKLGDGGLRIELLGRDMSYRDVMTFNVAPDKAGIACSSFVAYGHRTEDGGTIAGRNLDWVDVSGIADQQFLLVQAPDPKLGHQGFVTLTWPGCIGCFTAMNESGVTISIHDVYGKKIQAPIAMTPRVLALRSVAEKAKPKTARADAEAVLGKLRMMLGMNASMAVPCKGLPSGQPAGHIFEYRVPTETALSGTLVCRDAKNIDEAVICTNHHRSRSEEAKSSNGHDNGKASVVAVSSILADDQRGECDRYDRLLKFLAPGEKVTVESAWKLMHSVAFEGRLGGNCRTLHSVVFEPDKVRMTVQLATVEENASKRPRTLLPVDELIRNAKP